MTALESSLGRFRFRCASSSAAAAALFFFFFFFFFVCVVYRQSAWLKFGSLTSVFLTLYSCSFQQAIIRLVP
jgi:hypothetical protein